MTWEIMIGLVTIVGAVATIIKTVNPLIIAITNLTDRIGILDDKVCEIKEKKKEDHLELWEHNRTQDSMLKNHEQRLHDLDGKWYEP